MTCPGEVSRSRSVGLGATFPVGTPTASGPFSGANAGWQATIGLHRTVGSSGPDFGARVFYGGNGYEGPGEQDSSLSGATAFGSWTLFTESAVSPLLWSEDGFISHKYSADSGGPLGGGVVSDGEAFVVARGLGAHIPIGSSDLLLLNGYSHGFGAVEDVRYFILTAAAALTL